MVFSKLLLYLTKCCCVYIPEDLSRDDDTQNVVKMSQLSNNDIVIENESDSFSQKIRGPPCTDRVMTVKKRRLSDSEDEDFVVVV